MSSDQSQELKCQNHENTEGSKNSNLHEDTCVICLDIIRERAIATPCNHCTFDFICLVSWLQNNPKCPLCNTVLISVEYDWRAPHDYKTFAVSSLSATRQYDKDSDILRVFHGSVPLRHFPRERRPHSRPWQPIVPQDPGIAVSRRRYVYRHKLYSLHVGSNPQSRFCDFTAVTFSKSQGLQSRARMWIRRELQVFEFLRTEALSRPNDPDITSSQYRRWARRLENLEFLLCYIISILSTIDIKSSSGSAQRLLAEFLGEENAILFCHELNHWLRSPYTQLDTWDRHVQYTKCLPDAARACTSSMHIHKDERARG